MNPFLFIGFVSLAIIDFKSPSLFSLILFKTAFVIFIGLSTS